MSTRSLLFTPDPFPVLALLHPASRARGEAEQTIICIQGEDHDDSKSRGRPADAPDSEPGDALRIGVEPDRIAAVDCLVSLDFGQGVSVDVLRLLRCPWDSHLWRITPDIRSVLLPLCP